MRRKVQLSVILPVYNAQDYLEKCLFALSNQGDFMEVIVVDDGSTDKSGEIADSFAERFPTHIRVLHQKNAGVYAARAKGIEAAQGEFLGFCDSDDIPEPHMYHTMLERVCSAGADMGVCAYKRIDMQTEKTLAIEMTQFGDVVLDCKNPWFFPVINTALWNKIIRTELAREAINFETPPRILEDMMFLCSLYPKIRKMVFVSQPLYKYMVHSGSAMMAVRKDEIPHLVRCLEETRCFVEKAGVTWLEVCDCMAFIHLGLSVALKLLEQPEMTACETVKRMRCILNEKFPMWRHNHFLRLNQGLKHTLLLKPIAAFYCYRAHLMPSVLLLYRFVTFTLRIDIKW